MKEVSHDVLNKNQSWAGYGPRPLPFNMDNLGSYSLSPGVFLLILSASISTLWWTSWFPTLPRACKASSDILCGSLSFPNPFHTHYFLWDSEHSPAILARPCSPFPLPVEARWDPERPRHLSKPTQLLRRWSWYSQSGLMGLMLRALSNLSPSHQMGRPRPLNVCELSMTFWWLVAS